MNERIKRKRGMGSPNYDPQKRREAQSKGGKASGTKFDSQRAREAAAKSAESRKKQ